MSYRLPDGLVGLRDWLRAQGATDFATERQCAFMAQQLAGTRLKFPAKGELLSGAPDDRASGDWKRFQ
jgi:ribonuclease HI